MDISELLYSKEMSPLEFKFENLCAPPIECYLTYQDINSLYNIASSLRWASDVKKKYNEMDKIMRNRGFQHFACGTNRRIYRYLEDDSFLFKVAIDRVGLEDNPNEFRNQELLKPFVAKMFHTTPCGTVASVEKVMPIATRNQFKIIASDVFDMLYQKILGKYVLEDIGEKHFMNYGIRKGFGPCLLDYPYLFEVDYEKLQCKDTLPNGTICNGYIDYDIGFNVLKCERCGKEYTARSLQKFIKEEKIYIESKTDYRYSNFKFKVIDNNSGKIIVDGTSNESEIIY